MLAGWLGGWVGGCVGGWLGKFDKGRVTDVCSGTGEEHKMFNPGVMGSKPSQSLNSVGNLDLDLCRSNLAQCDASLDVGFRSRVQKGMLQCCHLSE